MGQTKRLLSDESGFTLLEVLIAITIMLISFASILTIESQSIVASSKAKEKNIVTMLAKNKMIESELEFEGKTFEEFKSEESGQFEEPYTEYTWTRTVKEIEFPELNVTSASGGNDGADGTGANGGNTVQIEQMTKLITQYLSDAVREVTVTISWNRGNTPQKYSVSTYWVNLNSEFKTTQ